MNHPRESASNLHLAAALLGLALPCAAQAPQWVQQFGSSQADLDMLALSGAAPDGSGGVFVCGSTSGNLAAPNAGGYDAWVARLDGAGTKLWVVQHGGPLFERLYAAASDGAGGVYVAGANGDVWPATGDAWIERLDGAGTVLWQRVLGTPGEENVTGAAPDGTGGVYVCGGTSGDLFGTSAGGSDVWVASLDASGALVWSLQFGSAGNEWGKSVAADGSGGFYVCGETTGDLGGTGLGYDDVWLARIDGAGALVWLRQYSARGQAKAIAVAAGAGGAFLAGYAHGAFAGNDGRWFDAWLGFVDDTGVRRWSIQLDGHANEFANALSPDGAGGIYVAGSTNGSLWGPHQGFRDAWVARYDALGNRLWGHQLGSATHESADALAPDGTGGVFAYGWTYGSLGAQNKGGTDPWVARY